MVTVLKELGGDGAPEVVEVWVDSAAAKCFVQRRGLGKMRHIEVRHLWFQHEGNEGRLVVRKVNGSANSADEFIEFLKTEDIYIYIYIIN